MFARWKSDPSYRRSQAADKVPVVPTVVARGLSLGVLGAGEDAKERQRVAQMLVDELSSAAGLPPCEVVVADRPQVHQHNGQRLQSKTYGYYRCWFEAGRVVRARIRIYHRTAVRRQVISNKVFLNTLLHEWTHHYDYAGLRLRRSPHTSGFFKRLRSIAEDLDVGFVMPPDPDEVSTVSVLPPPPPRPSPARGPGPDTG